MNIDGQKWEREDWVGAVVLTLAIGLVLVLTIIALGVAFGGAGPRHSGSYAGVVGAIIGSVATYIGGNRRER